MRHSLLLLLIFSLAACDSGGSDEEGPIRRAVITDVTVEAFPDERPDGSAWDSDLSGLTSDPDVYFELYDEDGDLIYTTVSDEESNVDSGPVEWELDPGITFNRFDQMLLVQVFDKDPSGEELMAETETFTLATLVEQERTFITLESANGDTIVTVRLRYER